MNHIAPRVSTSDSPPAQWLWGQAGTMSLADVGLILRRRLWLLIIPILLVAAPAMYMIMGLAPYYTAQSTVVIKPNAVMPGAVARPGDQLLDLQTDMEIITSERLARKVIAAAKLEQTPEFNPTLKPAETILPFAVPPWRDLLFTASFGMVDLRKPADATPAQADILEAEVLPRFAQRLRVNPLHESRVVMVQFTSETPELAARIPNMLADLYITHQLDAKFEAKKVATSWLQGRIAELRSTVEQQERDVETFRANSGIVQGRTSSLVAEQISTISTELITARADAQTAAARQRELENVSRQRGARAVLEQVASNLNPTTTRLLERDVELRQNLVQLSGSYGNQHPSVINVRQEIAALERKIVAEAQSALSQVQSTTAVARQKQVLLEEALGKLETEIARIKGAEVDMRSLEREAATNRTLLEEFLRQLNAQEQLAVEQPDAWVLSPAAVPSMQSGPNRKLLAGGTLIVTIALWMVMVVLAELLEGGIKSSDDVRSALAANPLGLVPKMPKLFGGAAARARYVLDKPTSAYAEALRSVYTALTIEQRRGGAGKTVMVTSSVAHEGKSTLVVSLGRMIARQGQKVLVIDCDLRRPNIARQIGERLLVNPTEPLPADHPMAHLVQEDTLSGAHVITAETLKQNRDPRQPAHLVHPNVLSQLLAGVQHLYDVILIDTPPVAPVADARALSFAVDHTVFVVHWKRTSPRVARYALDQLRDAGARISGVVLTQVQSKKHALYGFGDSAVTAKSAYRYYSS